jgi:hypothetical protein
MLRQFDDGNEYEYVHVIVILFRFTGTYPISGIVKIQEIWKYLIIIEI